MIGGERQLRDRNPISLGPAPADARRNAARVQADVDLVNTNIDLGNIGGGGGLTEVDVNDLINAYVPVTGGVGNVIGVPVGTPYLYVGPNLTQFPIDISPANLDLLKTNSGAFAQVDTDNATGLGADTVCMIGSGTGVNSKLIGFNTSAGTASAIGLTEQPRGFVRFGTDRFICECINNASVHNLYWLNNGVLETYTLTAPAANYRIFGVGPAANGTDVCVVWAKRSTTSGSDTTVYIRTYNTSGVQVSSQTTTVSPYNQANNHRVHIANGYIIAYLLNISSSTQTLVYVKAADTTSAWQYVGLFTSSEASRGPISSSGHSFFVDGNDLVRVNCANGAADVYANTFVNDEGTIHGIYPISSTKVVVTGVTTSSGDPFVDTIVISSGSANVTQTVITSTTSSWCFQPVALPSGDVVFGIQGTDATTGAYELLVSVAGP